MECKLVPLVKDDWVFAQGTAWAVDTHQVWGENVWTISGLFMVGGPEFWVNKE